MATALTNRFANALADAVLAPGSGVAAADVLAQLRAVESMIQSSPELRNVLLSPAVATSKKRAVLSRFGETMGISRIVRNFLFVIVDRRRSNLLEEIADGFETALDERMGVVRAEVKSAAPLSPQQIHAVEQELSRLAGKRVRSEFTVDRELIGGVVARIGSTVYDGSVRTRLENLREHLVSR